MTLASGTRLGPYEIQFALGIGGMGEVYRAHDSRLRRDVAIKVLPAAFGNDPERLARLEQEARTLSALNHPNILAIYDIGEREGSPFLVTELVEGKTLRQALEPAGTRLSVRRAVDCALQVAQALAAAHARGVLHRDVKPDNIVITADGHAKVLDFGLARLVAFEPITAIAATRGATEIGTVLGTIGYMPPEVTADPSGGFVVGRWQERHVHARHRARRRSRTVPDGRSAPTTSSRCSHRAATSMRAA
jgi:serine/threonine protein kinase